MVATNLKIVFVVLATLGVFTLVANTIPQVQSEVPEELTFSADVSAEELVAAGEALFNGAGACTTCHGTGTRAPNLLTDEAGTGEIGARCASRVDGQDCKTYLHASMVDPGAFVVEGYPPIMPDQRRTMSPAQIWSMVAYLQSVGGEVTVTGADIAADAGAPAPPPVTAGAPEGTDPAILALLQANTCLACHSIAGPSPLGPGFEGIGARLTPEEIETAIRDPNATAAEGFENLLGSMPPNFGEIMTDEEIDAVVEFLASLR
ncbi:MAG TPA: c-type cytochrome [Longimicrobiales bacterium]|nr:c-type cytochrome [Longimicrobiales bacterium]